MQETRNGLSQSQGIQVDAARRNGDHARHQPGHTFSDFAVTQLEIRKR
jgi:hypothetical protein